MKVVLDVGELVQVWPQSYKEARLGTIIKREEGSIRFHHANEIIYTVALDGETRFFRRERIFTLQEKPKSEDDIIDEMVSSFIKSDDVRFLDSCAS